VIIDKLMSYIMKEKGIKDKNKLLQLISE